MQKNSRIEAVYKLTQKALATLDNDTRESLLLNWWGIDESDEEFFYFQKKCNMYSSQTTNLQATYRILCMTN